MPVSANTLFHFTTKDNLVGILQNHFYAFYRLENLSDATPAKSRYKEAYIPMVCFCDLIFPQIKDHINFYGEYGIGLRKDGWGIQRGISPIIYLPENSNSSINFKSISRHIGLQLKKQYDRKIIRRELQNIYKYIKPYEGIIRNKKTNNDEPKKFYEEREWRFVPQQLRVLSKQKTSDAKIEVENEKIKNMDEAKLGFFAEDIKYIIVKEEKEIPDFANFIEKELKRFKPKERKLLVSKLISVTQINEDM